MDSVRIGTCKTRRREDHQYINYARRATRVSTSTGPTLNRISSTLHDMLSLNARTFAYLLAEKLLAIIYCALKVFKRCRWSRGRRLHMERSLLRLLLMHMERSLLRILLMHMERRLL